jgi:hypothetical protein
MDDCLTGFDLARDHLTDRAVLRAEDRFLDRQTLDPRQGIVDHLPRGSQIGTGGRNKHARDEGMRHDHFAFMNKSNGTRFTYLTPTAVADELREPLTANDVVPSVPRRSKPLCSPHYPI